MRTLGQDRGLKINEYGVFRGDKRVGGRDRGVGLRGGRTCPGSRRSCARTAGEIEAARSGELPDLVRARRPARRPARAHHGHRRPRERSREMVEAARRSGLDYLAITEHSKRLAMAHGLDEPRAAQQIEEIDRLNAELREGIRVLKGIEVDILEDGGARPAGRGPRPPGPGDRRGPQQAPPEPRRADPRASSRPWTTRTSASSPTPPGG